jgi:hypothetical protein
MQLTCPSCNTRFPLESGIQDADARRAVAAALRLPPGLGDLILRYLGCFRPAKRALAWERAARLLEALLDLIQTAQVTRNGITRPAPLDTWKYALQSTLDARDAGTLDVPLTNGHAYLEEIAWREAGRRQGKREARKETAAQSGTGRRSGGAPVTVAELAAKAEKEIARKAAGKAGAKALKDQLKGTANAQ